MGDQLYDIKKSTIKIDYDSSGGNSDSYGSSSYSSSDSGGGGSGGGSGRSWQKSLASRPLHGRSVRRLAAKQFTCEML